MCVGGGGEWGVRLSFKFLAVSRGGGGVIVFTFC